MDDSYYTSRIVPLIKDRNSLFDESNIRLLTINPILIKTVEALIKNRLHILIKDNRTRTELMGKSQIGFINYGSTDIHIYRFTEKILKLQ